MIANSKQKGDDGETRAAKYLQDCGFEIVAKNFRTKSGEIDLVAHKGEMLVFFEVKRWAAGIADTLELALGEKKQRKIIENSKIFLANNRIYSEEIVRFDVILVDFPCFPPVYHIENAFSES